MLRIGIRTLFIFCFSMFLTFSACASDKKKDPICSENSIIYFQCESGSHSFKLCGGDGKKLVFRALKNGQVTDHFVGNTEIDFLYSNYHRFKVNQNIVHFSTVYAKYEVFEYSDEESMPNIQECGVTITPLKGSQPINLLCNKNAKSKISSLADVLKREQ